MRIPQRMIFLYIVLLAIALTGAQEDDVIVVVRTDEALVLDCFVTGPAGDQDHDVTWFLDDAPVSTDVRLELAKLNHTHHGSKVTCYNGTALVTTRTIHFHHKMVFEVGDTLQLDCSTNPTAATNVTWKHDYITSTSHWVVTEPDNVTSQLMIPNLTLEDTGVYSCMSPKGVAIHVFNISVGLFPQNPSSPPLCSGCHVRNFRCEWRDIPETHLPTTVTFEYRKFDFSGFDPWIICEHVNRTCHLTANSNTEFRLNITNQLGQISVDVEDYNPLYNAVIHAPNINSIESLTSHKLNIRWTFSGCGLNHFYISQYLLTYRDGYTGNITVTELPSPLRSSKVMSAELLMTNANTEYCFWMQARTMTLPFGQESNKTCIRTLPTVPDFDFDGPYYTEVLSEEGEEFRDISLTWQLSQMDLNKPFQGVNYFELEVDRRLATTNQTNSSVFIYDLNGTNDYILNQKSFSYVIKDLNKYDNYTIVLSAVNSAGRTKATVQVHPSVEHPASLGSTGPTGVTTAVFLPGILVPLVVLLIIALLAFGFQRLKNNSRHIPEPVFHGMNHSNIRPKHVEHEVFDELPLISKEKQRQFLESLSSESGEEKGNRSYSSSSTEMSSLELGPVEKVLLLNTPDRTNDFERSPYCLLSQFSPTSPLQMAPDATEADLDSLPPCNGIYSGTDEGRSIGGSSYYSQLGGARDTPQANPYYSISGEDPGKIVQMRSDSGWPADGSAQADHQHCLRPTPVLANGSCYSQLASVNEETHSDDDSSEYCDSYVIAAGATGSVPQLPPDQSNNRTTRLESPIHYVPQTTHCVPDNSYSAVVPPSNSGYVDNTDVSMGQLIGLGNNARSVHSNPISRDSSPEHAVITHTLAPNNPAFSNENMDGLYFPDASFVPMDNNSFLQNGARDTRISNQATDNPAVPHNNWSTENGQVQMPPLADTHHNSVQTLQKPNPVAAVVPTLQNAANGYVPVAQIPALTQRSYNPRDIPAPPTQQEVQIGGRSPDLGPKIPQTSPDQMNRPGQHDIPADGYVPITQIPVLMHNSVIPQGNPGRERQGLHTSSVSSEMDTRMPQSSPAADQGLGSAAPVNGYVSLDQIPTSSQNSPINQSISATAQQDTQTGSGSLDMGTRIHQLLPGADQGIKPASTEQESLLDNHLQGSQRHTGSEPQETIPNNSPGLVRNSRLLDDGQGNGYDLSNDSPASEDITRRHERQLLVDEGYISNEVPNSPDVTEQSKPLELNKDGYVSLSDSQVVHAKERLPKVEGDYISNVVTNVPLTTEQSQTVRAE